MTITAITVPLLSSLLSLVLDASSWLVGRGRVGALLGVVVLVGGRADREHRRRVIGLRPARRRRLDPPHDVAVVVGLQRAELERRRAGRQRRGERQLDLVLTGERAAGPGDPVRADGRGPARGVGDAHVGERLALGEDELDLVRARVVHLVGDGDRHRRRLSGFGVVGGDLDVGERGARQGQHDRDDDGGRDPALGLQESCHRSVSRSPAGSGSRGRKLRRAQVPNEGSTGSVML